MPSSHRIKNSNNRRAPFVPPLQPTAGFGKMRAEGEIMKKISSALLAALLLLATVFTGAPAAMAAGVSVNASTVTVYFLNQEFRKKISQPAAYPASFQLKVTGADKATYRVTAGESATVSSTGLVEPLCTRYYWYGNVGSTAPTPGKTPDRVTESYTAGDSTVQVTAGGKTFRVTVHVQSYAQVYVDGVMQDYIAKNLPANPTDYDKAETAAKFAARYEYSANYSSYLSMVILGGGSCWASTGAVNRMCSLMGLPAWTRNGNKDAGAGSGHVNTLAQCGDGTYLEIEAGYDMDAPRPYNIDRRTSLFSYRSTSAGATVYQYDGKTMPATLTVPDTVEGKTVVGIGDGFLRNADSVTRVVLPETVTSIGDGAFNSCSQLQQLNLPAGLTTLGEYAFTRCPKLTRITSRSAAFPAENGVIYNADRTALLYAPGAVQMIVPSTVTRIGDHAFYYGEQLQSVTLPAGLQSIGKDAFAGCTDLQTVKVQGTALTEIQREAFAGCRKLKSLTLPASVQTLGERVFAYMASDFVLYGPATGALADYAAANHILYNHTHSFALTSTDPATCVNAGSKTYTCSACSATKTETIRPLGHQPVQALYPADFQYDGSVMTYCKRCRWVLEDSRTIARVTGVKLSATAYTYNGKVQKPSVTVKDSKGKTLKNGTDYIVSYSSGCKNVGRYTVKVTLKGNYSGTKSLTYNINPKGTGVSKVTATKKGFKVTWKKQATQTTEYEVQYSTSSKFKKAKTVTISKNKTTSKSVSKLSAKKKYYVRVRTYKTVKVNGKNVKLYSGWSKAKSVTTKK